MIPIVELSCPIQGCEYVAKGAMAKSKLGGHMRGHYRRGEIGTQATLGATNTGRVTALQVRGLFQQFRQVTAPIVRLPADNTYREPLLTTAERELERQLTGK